MNEIKIHVLHCGEVRVAPGLPFGGGDILKAIGLFTPKSKRIWLPVSSYLIEHPKGTVLVDCGWHREVSPQGEYNKKAQITHLSKMLFHVNQAKIASGQAVNEQLQALGIKTADIDYVLLTHLDCDHASGLKLVRDAKHILVAADEVKCAARNSFVRYNASMWQGVNMEEFQFNDTGIGPVGKSYDLFNDGSIVLVNIPGHADGLFAVVIKNNDKFVLLFSDGGYASKSWKEMILPGISLDKKKQLASLQWIRDMSMKDNCLESIANHDPDVRPHLIVL
jgi:N-acyl homoserine lactone hydrolase